ncbi:unnamed protein product [Cylicocyclus nassatus]|uniref:Uncharacterized protein n=1 Tax=Cylicocyclus nassatus TaxID=53992 RepID=A0AA36DTV3_CYLNA|nr:unnamed protein product [Cylicocyclus nassatus]
MMPNGRANGVPEAQDDRADRVALEVPNNEAAPNGQDDGDRIFGAANEAGDGENEELGMPNLGLPNGYHHEDDEDEVPEGPHDPILGLGARPLTRREHMLLYLRLNTLERALEAEDEGEFDEDEEVAPLLGPNADFRSVRPRLGCVVCGVNGHKTCDCEVYLEFRDRVRIVFAYRLCGRCAEFHDRRMCINHLHCARCRREDSHPTFLCWRPIPNE